MNKSNSSHEIRQSGGPAAGQRSQLPPDVQAEIDGFFVSDATEPEFGTAEDPDHGQGLRARTDEFPGDADPLALPGDPLGSGGAGSGSAEKGAGGRMGRPRAGAPDAMAGRRRSQAEPERRQDREGPSDVPPAMVGSRTEHLTEIRPDDPGFMEEFGSRDQAGDHQDDIFDWFALNMVDPLDVEDGRSGEDRVWPESPAREAADRQPPEFATEEEKFPPNATPSRPSAPSGGFGADPISRPDRRPSGPAAEFERSEAMLDGNEETSREYYRSPPPQQDPNPAGRGATGKPRSGRAGDAGSGRKWMTGRSGKRMMALAVAAGIVLLVSADGNGLQQTLAGLLAAADHRQGIVDSDRALAGEAAGDSAMPGGGAVTADRLAPTLELAVPKASPFREAGFIDPFGPKPAPPALAGLAAPNALQIELTPVDAAAGKPVPLDAGQQAEWDRLFEILDEPGLNRPTAARAADQPVQAAAGVGQVAGEPIAGGAPAPLIEFTADDGFSVVAMAGEGGSENFETHLAGYGPDGLAVETASEAAHAEPEALPVPHAAPDVRAGDDPAMEFGSQIAVLAESMKDIAKELAALDLHIRQLPGRISAAVNDVAPASLSEFTIGDPFRSIGRDLERGNGAVENSYVISTGSTGGSLGAALAGIEAGDHVDGFGEVIEVAHYGDGGRLLVMERGAVFLE